MAILDFRTSDLSSPETIAQYARADILALESAYLWVKPLNAGFVDQIKATNPDLKVIGYLNAHTSFPAWGEEEDPENPRNPYTYGWYAATRPYWAWTTTGDTMSTFPQKVMLNVLNPACRAAMIGVIQEMQETGYNRLDGALWDCFNNPLWIHPDASYEGEPDLDGDGVGYFEDQDEQEAYAASQVDLVLETRAALGDDFLQILNGVRALRDSSFAALGDGIMYERFPFGGFWGHEMAMALDPARSHNLFTARYWPRSDNGDPWVILANPSAFHFVDHEGVLTRYLFAEFNRVIALLTDTAVSYNTDDTWIYGWPEVELDLGPPLGNVSRTGDVLSREFTNGSVTLTLREVNEQIQFDYEIVQDGQVRQSFAFPYHFP